MSNGNGDRLAALLAAKDKAEQACSRWWRKLKQAFHALEKHSRAFDRLARKVSEAERK